MCSPPRLSASLQLLVGAAAASIVVLGFSALSDDRPAAEAPHRVPVALVDVAKVFKEGKVFNQKMQQLKTEIEEVDKDVRARSKQFEGQPSTGDNAAAPNTAAQAKQQAAKMLADAALLVKKQEFLQKEADIYAEYYANVETAVARLAKARDVGLVLRFTTDPYHAKDRASVLQAVNRPVIYSAVPDLTEEVIAALNADQP